MNPVNKLTCVKNPGSLVISATKLNNFIMEYQHVKESITAKFNEFDHVIKGISFLTNRSS